MLLNSTLHGGCITPFYDASLFPSDGGYIGGRLCAAKDQFTGAPMCCLPCPATHWAYSDSFVKLNTIAAWLNVVGLILQGFMLISYTFLPSAKTRSNYLAICLLAAVICINLAFVIPLGANPDQCYNEITPNDMHSSMTCAWSGAFLLAGALAGSFWTLIRALSMHLQICWDIVPGQKFFYISQAVGWGVPAALFSAALSTTGVSFRFGDTCHINHDDSIATFWGWLLAIAGVAVITQLCTFGYCIHVYLGNLWCDDEDRPSSRGSANSLPTSSSASIRTQKAVVIYHRLKSVLYLQWRGIFIVVLVLVDVIFFSVAFLYLDKIEASVLHDYTQITPWLQCLVRSGGDRYACFHLSQQWLISESTIGAVLIMMSLLGIELFLLLFRWSLISGWREAWTSSQKPKEFVSFDAPALQRGTPTSSAAFEMRKPGTRFNFDIDAKSIGSTVTDAESPRPDSFSDPRPDSYSYTHRDSAPNSPVRVYTPKRWTEEGDFSKTAFGSMSKPAQALSRNFSNPRTKTSDVLGWDPSSTFASSGTRHMVTPPLPRESEDKPHRSPGQAL